MNNNNDNNNDVDYEFSDNLNKLLESGQADNIELLFNRLVAYEDRIKHLESLVDVLMQEKNQEKEIYNDFTLDEIDERELDEILNDCNVENNVQSLDKQNHL